MARRDDQDLRDREIMDVIPERFLDDPDEEPGRGRHLRLILSIALGLLAVAALGVAARHLLFGGRPVTAQGQIPLVKADDRPIRTKAEGDARGGMDVPNRDKLVFDRNSETGGASDKLAPGPEQPMLPPAQTRQPQIKPAFQGPPPAVNQAPPPAPLPAVDPPAPAKIADPVKPAPAAAPARLTDATGKTAAAEPAKPAPAAPVSPPADAAKKAEKVEPAKKPDPAKTAAAAETAAAKPAAPAAAAKPAPAAHPATATAAPAPATVTPMAGGHWFAQLGALRTDADARKEWDRIKGKAGDLLGGLTASYSKSENGEHWRIRVGPFDEAKTRSLCTSLSSRGLPCNAVRK